MGDHAVFLSKYWSRLPYLGKIVDMWQTSGGRMKVKINWLYHKDEVKIVCRRPKLRFNVLFLLRWRD